MSSCSNAQSTKVGFAKNETAVLSTGNPDRAWISGEDREEEEEEDEDADFNPFLKDTPSQEASSSLSSEVDGLDGDVVSSGLFVGANMAELACKEQICASGGIEHGDEEIIMQSTVIPNELCDQELKKNATCDSLKRKSALISQSEIETAGEKDSGLSSKTEGNDVRTGELSNSTKSQGPVIEIDNEDAICMRTRARYSLASFSLDELEMFLQETDDDDDLQNVDDEEEYRKFLTAVLHGGDGDSLSAHENENVDDEDEDNDADFEIELEELLESDVDENASVKTRKEHDGAGRRPETRQNRLQKASTQYEKKSLGHVKRPLRPLLPSLPNGPLASGKTLMPDASLNFQSSASGSGLVNGFTPQQIGQLHSLIHEHMQLLIQVFSLSILDPSRQHIASQVQGLLFEMLHKRDEVLALKSVPYPSICFSPSYIGSSVSGGNAQVSLTHCSIESSSMCDAQRAFLPQSNVDPSDGRCEYSSNRQRNSFQEIEGCSWFPFVRGPVLSILDVSPISLVGRYVEDVHSAVQESRKRYLESACDTRVEKEPLFPCFPSVPESSSEVASGVVSKASNTIPTSPNHQQPKKTLAAMLVESTKKQSIALVPKEIAKLAQRFLPLFNPALFPHKPPLPAVVNRVLFTDSEDVLLALGLMEYNTDWKAIQQHFLPCKSKHQIFVRQKNRCSSKAAENPIKAVRKMKTSPLTKEEVAFIQEGLKVYKFDWMSVWKFIVPYRDPSLLPRQWRVALGTQKSYKQDASKREKRRLYEAKRRKLKSAASESWHAISDKEDCQTEITGEEIGGAENCTDNSGIAYVHQAFLADWRPDTCTPNCTGRTPPNSIEENHVNDAMPQEDAHYRFQQIGYGVCGKAQSQNKSTLSSVSQHLHTSSNTLVMEPRNPVFNMPTSTSKYYYRPYRCRRVNSTHLVKLAPDLPPVNLPPSVRIVSQTAFEGHQCKTSKIYPAGSGVATGGKDNCASHEKFGIVHSVKGARMQDSVAGSQLETGRPGTVRGRSVVAENGTSTDLQMHPLLFQAPEDGSTAYYPLKFSTGSSSSFSFFSGTQPQLNLSLFHNPHQQSSVDCSTRSLRSNNSTSRSGGIDFHPLLQKSKDTQFQTGFDAIQTESLVNDGVAANGSSSIEKSNDLDLEIHLSSASGREKSMKSKELKVHEPMTSTKAVAICGTSTKPQEINAAPCSLLGGKNLTGSSTKLDSCAHSLVVSNDNISSCDVDDIGDQSHPEIVMEQEELSDSEEDIEENVEFECEEMADSEGEDGSGCEQILEGQNKEISTSLGKVAMHAAGKENPCEPRANSDPQVDDSLPTNNTSTYKIAPTSERNDDKSNSSWLSLDSGTVDDPVLLKTKNDRAAIGEVPTSENVSLSRPSRCSKKTKSGIKGVTEEKHTMDMVQQLSLGPLAFAAPRKPRKRSSKSTASSNIGLTVESSSHDKNHNDG